ncbi:hypothetical protein BN2476_1280006 [Paraburkholderia piptadeniae]|uniref:Uncharacterized protein n=1 Tax=Paraburkholderia piptadeniae TaxID=1701573 RepID=A0A1N7SWC3_9BURK|nr:hypothetical protein [Paraburkholderia piptadeniae]SIT51657.1 hypothetical protein BN2476_1280006 [Paraburkholderia piptadeniae]
MANPVKRGGTDRAKRASLKSSREQEIRKKSARSAEVLGLLDFEAVYVAEPMDRIKWIKQGVDAGQVLKMALRLDMSQTQLMRLLTKRARC